MSSFKRTWSVFQHSDSHLWIPFSVGFYVCLQMLRCQIAYEWLWCSQSRHWRSSSSRIITGSIDRDIKLSISEEHFFRIISVHCDDVSKGSGFAIKLILLIYLFLMATSKWMSMYHSFDILLSRRFQVFHSIFPFENLLSNELWMSKMGEPRASWLLVWNYSI